MKRGRTCPCRNGDEYDVFTKWRRIISWARGETKRVKRGYNRRARREACREYDGYEEV
jgi:hypothetical protein